MPELPEVETIRLGLQKYLVGHKITAVEIRLKKQFAGDPKNIIGSKISGIRRIGKALIIDLNNGFSIAIHVKMTGQLIYRGPELEDKFLMQLPNKWTHVIFKIKDQISKIKTKNKNVKPIEKKSFLFYNDIRQFGWIKVIKTDDVFRLPFFKSIGPEPLKDLNFKRFSEILRKSKMPVKLLLMDQKKIAGIGNIYVCDALFMAKIHPKRPSSSLTDTELKNLFNALEAVLKKGIEVGGASQWNYVNVLGGKGGYQNFFKVYNRAGKKCPDCGETINRFKMGGRGTFICEKCQK